MAFIVSTHGTVEGNPSFTLGICGVLVLSSVHNGLDVITLPVVTELLTDFIDY